VQDGRVESGNIRECEGSPYGRPDRPRQRRTAGRPRRRRRRSDEGPLDSAQGSIRHEERNDFQTVNEVITIIGGGLAGSEAAWQVARQGIKARLYEMRPVRP